MQDVIDKIEKDISNACERSGRKPTDVKLVAVSKRFPSKRISDAYNLGQRVFGESRAQEFKNKVTELPQDIEWHFIGHLQRNKIKYVVPNAALIHSVDSLHLAEAISNYAVQKGLESNVLMEVNTSAEASKFGFSLDEALESYIKMSELPGIHLCGLMTMAPFEAEQDEIRACFKSLRNLKEKLAETNPDLDVSELSMGMSQDYEIAVEEGSTLVRIGTAIFGKREVL